MKRQKRVYAVLAMMLIAMIIAAAGSGCARNAAEDAGTEKSAQTQEPVDMVGELGLTAASKEATAATAEINSAVWSLKPSSMPK